MSPMVGGFFWSSAILTSEFALFLHPEYCRCCGPGSSFLSHAKRTHEVFPDVFRVNPKKAGYTHYSKIANASIPDVENTWCICT